MGADLGCASRSDRCEVQEGEDLHIDHGYPCRLIAASRPGVTQTKWLSSLEVLA